jgi:PAS domain S-box-containing protein
MDVINQDRVTDPARLQRLRELMVLDAEPDPALDRLTSLASRVLKMPISLVSLVDAHRQFFASGVGLEDPWASARQTPLEYSYCKHVVATNEPLIISDARTEPLTADSPSIVELNAIAYAGFPLMLSDGTNLGSFCVLDNKPHTWTPEELAILSDLAQSAITELELRSELLQRQRAEKALEEARRFTEETLRAVPDFVFVYRLATRQIVYANRSAASVLGYSAEQMRAMVAGPVNSGDIFAALVHPDDVATLLNEREALLSAPSDNLRETEFRLKHADGTWHWFQARGKIFERHPETGMPDTVLGTAADVTERRRIQDERNQTESRLRSLVRVENEFAKSLEIDDILLMTMDMALRFTGASDGYIAMMENDDILHLVTRAGVYEKDTRFFAEEGIVGRAVRTRSPQLVPDVRRDPEYVQNVDRTVAQKPAARTNASPPRCWGRSRAWQTAPRWRWKMRCC